MSEFIKAEGISGNRVRYTDLSGKTFIHSKGTWAWRNNNPGNIRKPSKDNMPNGVIGYVGLRFGRALWCGNKKSKQGGQAK